MVKKLKMLFVTFFAFGFTYSAIAADLVYIGEVTGGSGALGGLVPIGTLVGGPIQVDDAALASGSIGVGDFQTIAVRVGNFCFATEGLDCNGAGALVPIESIDSATVTVVDDVFSGAFSVTAFSPTFEVFIPIDFDLDAGTFSASEPTLGMVSGVGALSNGTDEDSDGIFDGLDNCSVVPNTTQEDADDDGFGNACDGDFNNDCSINFIDISMFGPEFLGTNPVFDLNSDGQVNFIDFSLLTAAFLGQPGPSDLASCDL